MQVVFGAILIFNKVFADGIQVDSIITLVGSEPVFSFCTAHVPCLHPFLNMSFLIISDTGFVIKGNNS